MRRASLAVFKISLVPLKMLWEPSGVLEEHKDILMSSVRAMREKFEIQMSTFVGECEDFVMIGNRRPRIQRSSKQMKDEKKAVSVVKKLTKKLVKKCADITLEVSSGVHQKFDDGMTTDFADAFKNKPMFQGEVAEAWIKGFCQQTIFEVRRCVAK